MDKSKRKRVKLVNPDEPYFTENTNGGGQEDEVMVKDGYVIMNPKEAKRKRPLPAAPMAPTPVTAPVPSEEEIIASEDELPEAIEESDIPDMDVPDEEKEFEEVDVAVEEPQPKPYKPVLAPGHAPRPTHRHGAYHSPASEQISGMPFLSQGTIAAEKGGVGGVLLLLAGIAIIGGIIYFLKRKS